MAKTRRPTEDDEAKFLAAYRPEAFPRPAVTVDIVILTLVDADLKVLLVRRSEHPFKGKWALPGGFVRVGDARGDHPHDHLVGHEIARVHVLLCLSPELGPLLDQPVEAQPLDRREQQPQIGFRLRHPQSCFDRERARTAARSF